MCRGIDRGSTGPDAVHLMLLVPAGWPDVPAGDILLRPQVGLRERRSAKGDARFRADDGDRVNETVLADRDGGGASCQAATDDHDSLPAGSLSHPLHLPAPA